MESKYGQLLNGKYRLDALIGSGAMGAVYRATHIQLQREVAVKLVRERAAKNELANARFRREALAIARLNHPNIVTIHDFDIDVLIGRYIVMELLVGRTLRDYLKNDGVPEPHVGLRLMTQIASAVESAHGKGILHRDLKPENIFLIETESGPFAKVLDFGIAKLADEEGFDAYKSDSNAVIGTPQYMSPEQIEGFGLDRRTDVYALGCVFYEMLAGKPPFTGGRNMVVMLKHVTEAPEPLENVAPSAPSGPARAIMRALAKSPADRFASVADFAAALAAPETSSEPLTSFVGREAEIESVSRLLEGSRLVTLVGPGGIGKTRLGLAVADAVWSKYPDGVRVVELASTTDPALVASAVASVVGVSEAPAMALLGTVCLALRTKRMLLVFDNCEHVAAAASDVGRSILKSCPGVQVLATSREPLGIAGEQMFPVPPMGVSEAGALLADRVRRLDPEFAITDANAATVAELCRQLDGLPLAIELAAARAKVLTLEQILARMGDRFQLLGGSTREMPARHETLRATIDWSYAMLDGVERAMFERLAIFSGGFTLEAAEAVCSGGLVDRAGVMDLLGRLSDRSLLAVDKRGAESRFRPLETIRQYALERLREHDEFAGIAERHLAWCTDYATAGDRALLGEGQARWLSRFELEHDNFRAALATSLEQVGSASSCLELTNKLSRFWEMRGHWTEGRQWLERGLALGERDGGLPDDVKSLALTWLGVLSELLMDLERARAALEEGVALRRREGAPDKVAGSLSALASVLMSLGDFDRADECVEEYLAYFREQGKGFGISVGLDTKAIIAMARDDLEMARRCAIEAIEQARGANHSRSLSNALCTLGTVERRSGNTDEAERLFLESLAIARELDHKALVAMVVANLGLIELERGSSERATLLLNEGLATARRIGDSEVALRVLDGVAEIAMARGDAEEALRYLGANDAYRERLRYARHPADQRRRDALVNTARSALGDAADATYENGRRSTQINTDLICVDLR